MVQQCFHGRRKITTQQLKYSSNRRTIRKLGRTAFIRQRVAKRSVKEIIKPFAIYITVFAVLIATIALNYRSPQRSNDVALGNVSSSETQSQDSVSGVIGDISIDKKVATDIAADFAMQTNMPIASNVSNLSISLSKE